MAISTVLASSMSRAPAYVVVSELYSELAALLGMVWPAVSQKWFPNIFSSPRSAKAMMLRPLVVVPDLFVTHTSTRLISMPVARFGNFDIASS